ncbi:fumarylacetoacetate hydrolase family protein [Sphingomonas sp. So64.6b]|uniref:fumarylacetoacetate hydrolase family protein n=1 Tax=Sphingomonas sp. So64.6b TaxID=2997354 RepID=UPI0016018335|nr:fumarylacetoacetate hydrolase family protein [Sphingomonas sp. So64.6b]QNA85507.1 fumarylacetoacetate hydrolase family protein [Sphingomonas sp. So64.6b]
MKFVTFTVANGLPTPGAIAGDGHILNIAAAARAGGGVPLDDMLAVIAAGRAGLARIASWLAEPPAGMLVDSREASLLAPLMRPTQIRDCGNYEKHVSQAIAAAQQLRARATPDPEATLARFRAAGAFDIPPVWYEQPLYYKGNPMTVVGPDADIVRPSAAKLMDYELELAAIIGGPAKNLSEADALDAVFGYTIFNDFSARDLQSRETSFRFGPAKGKDFDTGNAIGPYIVSADEIADPEALTMIVRVNGVEKVRTTSGNMQHSAAKTIAYISTDETLHPGDLIAFGTVGDGCGYESLTFLDDGDVVELEVEGIGVLRNRLVSA